MLMQTVTILNGKYDHLDQDIPYSAIIEALDALINSLLILNEEVWLIKFFLLLFH
jgi:hypothetical protein